MSSPADPSPPDDASFSAALVTACHSQAMEAIESLLRSPSLPEPARIELTKALAILQSEPASSDLQQFFCRKVGIHVPAGLKIATGTGGIAADRIDLFVQVNNPQPAAPSPEMLKADALARWRHAVARQWGTLRLCGAIEQNTDRSGGDARPGLCEVYVGLATTTLVEEKVRGKSRKAPDNMERRELTVLAAVAANPQCLLLGHPGGGKSTFLRHLAVCMASGYWQLLPEWPDALRQHVPVYLEVRQLAAALPADEPADGDRLTTHLEAILTDAADADLRADVAAAVPHLLAEAEAGRVVLLADGLDEVASIPLRARLRNLIADWLHRHPGCRAVVTCRAENYRGAAEGGWEFSPKRWPTFEIAGFDSTRIGRFVRGWYEDRQARRLMERPWQPEAESLLRQVRRSDLAELAPNPLLLTMMTHLHCRDLRLPDGRVPLYERMSALLLFEWEYERRRAGGGTSGGLKELLSEAKVTEKAFLRGLAGIAWKVHSESFGSGAEQAGDFSESTLRAMLRRLRPRDGTSAASRWEADVMDVLTERAGLIAAVADGRFSFPHRTFREFMAARRLVLGPDSEKERDEWPGFLEEALKLVATPDSLAHWRVVLRLAAGRCAQVDEREELIHPLVSGLLPGAKARPQKHLERFLLAGELLAEAGPGLRSGERIEALWSRVEQALIALMVSDLPAPDRARAGMVLGHMGDPRPGVVSTQEGIGPHRIPVFAWSQEIPSGPFPMGNDQPEVSYWPMDTPRITCTRITERYKLALYPVTVGQYECFIQAGGYTTEGLAAWWTPEGREWAQTNDIHGPENYDAVFQTPNHPRVGVSWYEAVAFCRWFNDSIPAEHHRIALPAEAHWEHAARNGAELRRYPWGGEWENQSPHRHANMGESGIGHTSPVGIFPAGAAACGARDISGNVWEWCRTVWRENLQDYNDMAEDAEDDPGCRGRVLRGGSCYGDPDNLRASIRYRNDPDFPNTHYGFRVMWLPPF